VAAAPAPESPGRAGGESVVSKGATGVGAGGVALADEVVAVLAGRGGRLAELGGLALGLPQPAPRRAAVQTSTTMSAADPGWLRVRSRGAWEALQLSFWPSVLA
jgi:hypothetical protein